MIVEAMITGRYPLDDRECVYILSLGRDSNYPSPLMVKADRELKVSKRYVGQLPSVSACNSAYNRNMYPVFQVEV